MELCKKGKHNFLWFDYDYRSLNFSIDGYNRICIDCLLVEEYWYTCCEFFSVDVIKIKDMVYKISSASVEREEFEPAKVKLKELLEKAVSVNRRRIKAKEIENRIKKLKKVNELLGIK